MLSLILLLAGLNSPGSPGWLMPASEDEAVRAGSVVVHRQPEVPLVALRLSLLAYDPPGYAGAGHMIQHVQYPGLRERAARVGGRVEIQRTSDAVIYTVIGPSAELQYLSQLLISTLQPQLLQTDGVLRAERELREERLAEWETAPAHTRSMLRAQLFPHDLSAAGTERAATRFTASTLPEIWARMYRPELVSVVAVGDVYLADVQREFSQLPPARSSSLPAIQRDSVILSSLAPPQATRAWFGRAYLASDLDPAAVTVAARLVGDYLRERAPTAQVDVEHWWTHHGQALAIVAAVPQAQMDATRRLLDTAVAGVLNGLRSAAVVGAAAAVRREMLFHARTPDRMADVLGRFVERDGDPNAAERFYADLDGLEVGDVRGVLEKLIERTPARVETPPQALLPRRI